MCVNPLKILFESLLKEIADEKPESFYERFETELKKKKYDAQDKTIIEVILKEEEESLRDLFAQRFGAYFEKCESNVWDTEKSSRASAEFFSCLEQLINYYYNNVIAGQFSGG